MQRINMTHSHCMRCLSMVKRTAWPATDNRKLKAGLFQHTHSYYFQVFFFFITAKPFNSELSILTTLFIL